MSERGCSWCEQHGTCDPPNCPQTPWWLRLTPLQRVVIAVLRAAMSESLKERDAKRRYEEAVYGRP